MGLGRHGPWANVFAYFVDPHGLAIEYTCEMEQVDETYLRRVSLRRTSCVASRLRASFWQTSERRLRSH